MPSIIHRICLAALLAALPMVAVSDWCDGRKLVFFAMPPVERIQQGAQAVAREQSELERQAGRIKYTIQDQVAGLIQSLEQEIRDFTLQAQTLCRSAGYSGTGYPIDYQGISLRDRNELIAQLRLNLITIHNNQRIVAELKASQQELVTLHNRMVRRANELAVLKKGFDQLADPRDSTQGNYQRVLRNACVVIHDSTQLRAQYVPYTADERFAMLAKKSVGTSLSQAQLDIFLRSCRL